MNRIVFSIGFTLLIYNCSSFKSKKNPEFVSGITEEIITEFPKDSLQLVLTALNFTDLEHRNNWLQKEQYARNYILQEIKYKLPYLQHKNLIIQVKDSLHIKKLIVEGSETKFKKPELIVNFPKSLIDKKYKYSILIYFDGKYGKFKSERFNYKEGINLHLLILNNNDETILLSSLSNYKFSPLDKDKVTEMISTEIDKIIK